MAIADEGVKERVQINAVASTNFPASFQSPIFPPTRIGPTDSRSGRCLGRVALFLSYSHLLLDLDFYPRYS